MEAKVKEEVPDKDYQPTSKDHTERRKCEFYIQYYTFVYIIKLTDMIYT